VILGVTQMMFGLCLSLSNALFFKDYAAVWLEFVPQVIFLMCTFGKPTDLQSSRLSHNPHKPDVIHSSDMSELCRLYDHHHILQVVCGLDANHSGRAQSCAGFVRLYTFPRAAFD
jgi:hypothetical protein